MTDGKDETSDTSMTNAR